MPDNAILATIDTDGCSDATARPERVEAGAEGSRKIADVDFARVNPLRARFEAAAAKTNLPAALLAAIASRETHCGAVLDHNGEGDGGAAFGIMQVDKRSHVQAGRPDPRSQEHIDQAAGVLQGYLNAMRAKFPEAAEEDCLLAAVSAYNCGPGNVRDIGSPDDRTAHGDYSSDTWVRAQFFADKWAAGN
jgi:membrane-bound lytic murein transglycosylase MltF